MSKKHKVLISVADKSGKKQVLRSSEMSLPLRILRFLFGDYGRIMVLTPAESVTSIEVKEIPGGAYEQR